jgi:YVTN family beta-propeller protein
MRQEKGRNVKYTIADIAGLCFFTCLLHAGQRAPGQWLSPHVLAGGKGNVLYVAAATSKKVIVFDAAAEKVIDEIPLPCLPSGMVLSSDALRLYVTAASPNGEVYTLDTDTRQASLLAKVGHTPNSPVLSPDGKTLYVCNRFNDDVSVIDTSSGNTLGRIPVLREPIAAALTPDGSMLVVANHLPAGRSDQDYVAAAISLLDTQKKEVLATIGLPNGSTGLQGLCVSARGCDVTHILGGISFPAQLERGWMNTNALSIIDLGRRTFNTVSGRCGSWRRQTLGRQVPRRQILIVSLSERVTVPDRPGGLHAKISRAAVGEQLPL